MCEIKYWRANTKVFDHRRLSEILSDLRKVTNELQSIPVNIPTNEKMDEIIDLAVGEALKDYITDPHFSAREPGVFKFIFDNDGEITMEFILDECLYQMSAEHDTKPEFLDRWADYLVDLGGKIRERKHDSCPYCVKHDKHVCVCGCAATDGSGGCKVK